MNIIDIHSHILPGVDDGSPDMEDSILMAELAVEGGVDTIIATSHGNMTNLTNEGSRKTSEKEHTDLILKTLSDFREELGKRNIPLRIYPGMEIFSTPDAAKLLKEGILLPLAEGPYCLMEFDFEDPVSVCTRRIEEMLDAGFRPIIAHPERYTCVQEDPDTVREWIRLGCQLQVNRGSILGRFGEDVYQEAWRLLDDDLVTYIGSDAHSPYFRTTYMKDVYEVISEEYSSAMADRLMRGNAETFLLGR